ncbi:VOC family protein [Streptomyces sp. NPDC059740]|uniref:VOC family protein n=1 Tax=Streptomyces sp. NPDC059740 TaxID=3346926 RepID=UPI0036496E14
MAIAKLGVTALDCPDPAALAAFYAALVGGEVVDPEEDDWVEVEGPDGERRLAFQRVEGYQPPSWPGQEQPQQLHLDFDVPRAEIDEAERQVLALGAKLAWGDEGERNFRVYLDPAGHPFCLCMTDRA